MEFQGAKFEFKAQDKLGRPEGEEWQSLRVIPSNATGAYNTLNFSNSNFYVRRGWLNAALDGIVRGMYNFSNDNKLALYRQHDENRVNGGAGWAHRTLFGLPDRGIWGRRRLGDGVFNFRWPSLIDPETGVREPVGLTTWVFLRQRSREEFLIENTWKDAKTGESNAELKHNALFELASGTSVVVPCTIGVMSTDGRLLDGEQNIVKLIKRELEMLNNGETQEALRDAEWARRAEYRQEQTLDTRIEKQVQVREEQGIPTAPAPDDGFKIRVAGHIRKLDNLEKKYYAVWPLNAQGNRLSVPEYSMIMLAPGTARAQAFAHPESYDLEPLQ